MSKRANHYEAAFEEYLRAGRIPYVAVDETRRSLTAAGSIKSLDFIVSGPVAEYPAPWKGDALAAGTCGWLVDVKGRQFPAGRQNQYWRNWSTIDDVKSLTRWQDLFGPRFVGLLVFAFNVVSDRSPVSAERLFGFRGELYAFVGIRLDLYASWARQISGKWQTVAMPSGRFRELAQPVDLIFSQPAASPRSVADVDCVVVE